MSELAEKKCPPCDDASGKLGPDQIVGLRGKLGAGWEVVNGHHLHKSFKFPDFKSALEFTNRAGAVAEEMGHHPDILLSWGKVEITIFTHKVDGLTDNDFVLAAKIEERRGGRG
jgi:4a-hydroxytetrahydrobiopterin dehydratase